MRQLKNCKKGHFVKYKDVICQVNCFYTSLGEKHATLIQVGEPEEKNRCSPRSPARKSNISV